MTYTMRQLIVMHDAMLLRDWDQTALLSVELHNLTQLVATFGSKKKPKMMSWAQVHPYRKETLAVKSGVITADNIDTLRNRFLAGQEMVDKD